MFPLEHSTKYSKKNEHQLYKCIFQKLEEGKIFPNSLYEAQNTHLKT